MLDDGHSFRTVGLVQRVVLLALPRVGHGFEVARIAECRSADADPDPGVIHHVKHRSKALVLLTEQVAHRAVGVPWAELALTETEHRVRRSTTPHLAVQAHHRNIVAFTDLSDGGHEELGNYKQGEAFGPRR